MQKPILPKGTRDFNSEDLYKRNYIINIIKDNFSKFGFNPIETPSFERSETLLGKYGQEGERLIFKILKSGNFLKNVDGKDFEFSNLAPKIVDKALYVNSQKISMWEHGKFLGPSIDKKYNQPDIFLSSDINVNRDHLGPIYVPKKGDVFSIHEETNWKYLLPLLLMEGNTATLENNGKSYHFTLQDPNEIFRRKGKEAVFDEYFSEYNQNGKLITPWNPAFKNAHFKYLMINGEPASLMNEYKLKQNYYWAMGDNRDDSLDSRYWGFVPENFILGEALFTYFSLNLNTWIPRWDRIGTVLK